MARAKPDLSPVQAFLEPLARLALRDPMIEALVFWESGGWPSAPAEATRDATAPTARRRPAPAGPRRARRG